ncbi:Gamma-tubulin complex component 5 [Desmophyllum pertusum]|uniref:Gamma-tubulin complex component n=1 Tax=Desmophyllum pertusum TaxID=174260 RepID=A0A9W9ZVH2_9CNID|nr:Gamma-tubulin complex component 5 [Desmophyllum pertusum]
MKFQSHCYCFGNKLRTTLDEISTLYNIYQAAFLETEELNTAQKTCKLLTTLYIRILQTDRLGSAAKWKIFRAGKSVELIQGLGKMGELYSLRTKGSLYQGFLDQLLTALSSNHSSNETAGTHEATKDGRSLIDTIASSDQVLSVINDTGDHVFKALLHGLIFSKPELFPHKEGVSKLLKPVELLLTECLTPLIEECCTQASCSVIHLMITDFCLLDHLAAMRNFFLLEAGDAMHQFYVEIFNKARQHDAWQDISFLNSLIQEALQPRFPDAVGSELSTAGSSNRKQLGPSLQGLALHYRAPWPVNIVIDSSCQKLYNLVFLFLLKLKQAKWSLDELRFSDLAGDRRLQKQDDASDDDETDSKPPPADSGSPPDQELLHKMFVFRFKLMQFINSIHNHFMTRILHSTGLEFQEALDQAKDLDDLIKAHSSYVEKLYDRCLLSQKVGYLREVILKVLNLVLLFQTYWDNGAQHINEEKFKKMDEEFTKCNTFLISCLGNIAKRGAFPHLESLAFALTSSPSISSKA